MFGCAPAQDDGTTDPTPLWDSDDPEGSGLRLREAAAIAEGADQLVLMTRVSRATGLQERYHDAHGVLDHLATSDQEVEVLLTNLGMTHGDAGDFASALGTLARSAGRPRADRRADGHRCRRLAGGVGRAPPGPRGRGTRPPARALEASTSGKAAKSGRSTSRCKIRSVSRPPSVTKACVVVMLLAVPSRRSGPSGLFHRDQVVE
jgi:hypothetical protein